MTDENIKLYRLLCHSLGSSVHYRLPDGPSGHWLLFFDLMVQLIFSPSNSLFIQLMFAQVLLENAEGDFLVIKAIPDHYEFLMTDSSHEVTSVPLGESHLLTWIWILAASLSRASFIAPAIDCPLLPNHAGPVRCENRLCQWKPMQKKHWILWSFAYHLSVCCLPHLLVDSQFLQISFCC